MKPALPAIVKFSVLLATSFAFSVPHANEFTGRLKRIQETGTLVAAYGETATPFSYVDTNGPAGFGVDISKRIAESLRNHLGLKELRIRWNPVTLSTRFPLILTNTVDLECITTTNTRARQQTMAFSTTYFIAESGIATRRDAGISSLADLRGKRIAVARNTTTEQALASRAAALGVTLVPQENNRRAMTALADGKVDAYAAANTILAGELLRIKEAAAFAIIPDGNYREALACTLPKDDGAFKQAVDTAIIELMRSGEMEKLYAKWFSSPISPYGRAINLPLSQDNRALYLAPNDTPFE